MYHRLIYGLRHGQHHIGRPTIYLDQEGIDIDTWEGQGASAVAVR